jgi:hypothetical protein
LRDILRCERIGMGFGTVTFPRRRHGPEQHKQQIGEQVPAERAAGFELALGFEHPKPSPATAPRMVFRFYRPGR